MKNCISENSKWMLIVAMLGLLPVTAVAEEDEFAYQNVQAMDLRDDDGDGVINSRDMCADTPVEGIINDRGCVQWDIERSHKDFVFNYAVNEHKLSTAEHKKILNEILQTLAKSENSRVLLVGDTSIDGSAEFNKALAEKRANSVVQALLENDVPQDRIIGFVFGDMLMQQVLKKRERRTIVRVVFKGEDLQKSWTIYDAEEKNRE